MPHLAFDPIDVDAFGGIGGGGVTLAVPLGFRRAERHYAFDPGDGHRILPCWIGVTSGASSLAQALSKFFLHPSHVFQPDRQ